jgi:starch synthase
MSSPLRLLFLASEADPFVKVGGLGDVAGSLPKALRKLSHPIEGISAVDARLVIPFHGVIRRESYDLRPVVSFTVLHSSKPLQAEVYATEIDGLPVYLIGGEAFPSHVPVYSDDWGFDAHKYIFFSLAALQLTCVLGWKPHIVHANDWHTAAAIYSLYLRRDTDPFFRDTATLLTVHNLPYMGMDGGIPMGAFGLPPTVNSLIPDWARHLPLPLGLLGADHVVAVSPTYAQEILTPGFGSGLQEFLRSRAETISGILNGIDIDRWNPATDTALAANFDSHNLSTRQTNKMALANELGLPFDPSIPLLAMITRMDYQKGIDLALDALRLLAEEKWQVIFLGTGSRQLEEATRQLEQVFPDRVRAIIRFDTQLSHRIYGGADAMLIPSRYEPCGLVQMIAMRYGCVPVVRATGGLCDTVQEKRTIEGSHKNGFVFEIASPQEMAETIRRVLSTYSNHPAWQVIQQHGMQDDFSWEKSAQAYVELYQSLTSKKGKRQGRNL